MQKEIEQARVELDLSKKYYGDMTPASTASLHAQRSQALSMIAIAELLAKLVGELDNITGMNDGELHIRIHDIGR